MDLRKEDLPTTLQAFELQDNNEIFLAEQVVNTQSEIETFTSRFAGKLIKAKKISVNETSHSHSNTVYQKKKSSAGLVMVIIIIIIIALVLYGFSTGWIQEKFNLKI